MRFTASTLFVSVLAAGICSTSACSPDPGGSPADGESGPHRAADEDRDTLDLLSALGYTQGSEAAPREESVTAHDPRRAYDGVNLVLSAHAPGAFLMDMEGRVLHTWSRPFEGLFAEPFVDVRRPPENTKSNWRRVHLFENGDLLAIFTNFGLFKLDKDSNLLWTFKRGCHHDLFVRESGDIVALTRRFVEREPLPLGTWKAEGRILEDAVTIVSPDGEEIRSVSILDAFLDSSYAPHLEHVKHRADVFHTNTVRPIRAGLEDDFPMFKEGHLLLSLREIHTIAVLDPENEVITWALTGQWKFQHEPRLLENGHLLLFDNRGNRGRSQVLEIDPLTQEIVWAYRGDPPESFHSKDIGSVDRLPNGNTLIVESRRGRAFEVTPDKEIVWEFVNPHRTGVDGALIANLVDVVRLEHEDVAWLEAPSETE